MVCVYCGSETHVNNSRHQKRVNQVWRRRICKNCGATFTTHETADLASALRVKNRGGKLSPLSRDKLLLSLYKSLGHRRTALSDASGLCDTILAKVAKTAQNGVIEATSIIQTATVTLNRFDTAASTHYQAFHRGL